MPRATIHRATITLATATLLSVGALAAPAQAAELTIRPGEFIADLSDTRAKGHVEFLGDGLSVVTEASDCQDPRPDPPGGVWCANKAAEYWATDVDLAGAGEPTMTWIGTDLKPGIQLVVDLDADGTADGILVGEAPTYGDRWWANSQATAFITADEGSTAPGAADGYQHSGNLDAWRAAYPEAHVVALGFSLGSGVRGAGVIKQTTLGGDTYRFSNQAEPQPAPEVVAVTGKVSVGRLPAGGGAKRGLVMTFVSEDTPEGAVQGAKLRWRVKIDGRTVYTDVMGADETSQYRKWFPRRSGKHTFEVFKNGVQVKQGVINVR